MTQRHLGDLVRNQNPVVLAPTASVVEACRRMAERRVGAVVVVDAALRPVGIFTGRDAVGRVIAGGLNAETTPLADVMTCDPSTLPANCTAIECLRLMQDCGFRHVPIVDEGKLVGIVSRGDFRGREQDRLDEESGLWERIA